jgi:hypothetical protein
VSPNRADTTVGAGASAVVPPVFEPKWLAVEDVKAWLRLAAQDTDDDDLLIRVCAMAEPYVERCRPEFLTADVPPVYIPDAEAYQGGVMYAAREYRRRNSPAGIETFGDTTSFVTRYDTDIERALHTGAWAPPVIA